MAVRYAEGVAVFLAGLNAGNSEKLQKLTHCRSSWLLAIQNTPFLQIGQRKILEPFDAGRQKSLLGNAAGCVAPGGHLLYTTCTFSREENEKVVEAFLRRHSGWRAVECPPLAAWGSAHGASPCYRLYPHQACGAGGFSCLLGREGEGGDLPALDPALLAWPVPGALLP